MDSAKSTNNVKATLNALWEGNVPLAKTFWLFYFIGMMVIKLLAGFVGPIMGIAVIGWAGFMVMPIWRSADKYEGNKLFALLAKIAAVLIAIGVLGTLF